MKSAARTIAFVSSRRLAALASGIPVLALAVLTIAAPAAAQEATTAAVLVYHSTDPAGAAPGASLPPGCESVGASSVITWTLQGVGFADEESATGSFVYDTSTSQATGWSIAVTTGSSFPALTYTEANSTFTNGSLGNPQPTLIFRAAGNRELRITPTAPLDAPGTVPIDLATAGGGSGSVECFNCAPFRPIVSGALVGEAAPAEGLDCALTGNADDVIELWVDGGDYNGVGNLCQMGDEGGTGDQVCGADILLEITDGLGRFTRIDAFESTLVHSPACVPDGEGPCQLPSEPATTEVRMNFRRGVGDPPLGARHVADFHLDTTGSSEESPTVVKMRNFIAAGARLQERPLATLANGEGDAATIARGPVPVPEPGGMLMLASGLAGLAGLHRLRGRRQDS